MTPEEMTQVAGVVESVVKRAIDGLRDEMIATVEVLNSTDHAIVAELQRLRGSGGEMVAEVMERAGDAWERFVKNEAKELGYRMIKEKE